MTDDPTPDSMKALRKMMRSDPFAHFPSRQTDQRLGKPQPPLQKAAPEGAPRFALTPPGEISLGGMSVVEAMRGRRSQRKYLPTPLSGEELAFLCWATQGVHAVTSEGTRTSRTVPSGGARHPFETYLAVQRVEGLEPGLYRYLALEHELCLLEPGAEVATALAAATAGFAVSSAVVFIWSAVPYRCEWRYAEMAAKLVMQDSGHVCQNMYLACEAIGAGTCAVSAYQQEKLDALLGLDGEEEFVVYCAPVGKVRE